MLQRERPIRICLIICAAMLIHLIVPGILDAVNRHGTVSNDFDGDRCELTDEVQAVLHDSSDGELRLLICSREGAAATLVFEDSHLPHEIFVNGILQDQPEGSGTPSAYRALRLGYEDHAATKQGSYETEIRLVLLGAPNKVGSSTLLFVGTEPVMSRFLARRTMINSIFFACYLLIFFMSAYAFYRFRTDYLLITMIFSLSSLAKSMIYGELPLAGITQLLTPRGFFMIESTIGIISFLFSQMLFYTLFDIHIARRRLIGYLLMFLTLESSYLMTGNPILISSMHLISVLIILTMGIRASLMHQRWGITLTLSYMCYSATVLYRFLITFGVFERGIVSAVLFSPQIGSVIFLFTTCSAVISTYLGRVREYEQQQKLHERMVLLRGLSHDLKIPLSIIKLNSQMLENYDLSDHERRQSAGNSLRAAADLEQMAQNITCYLHDQDISERDTGTPARQGMQNLQEQFEQACREKGISLIVQIPERDCLLPVSQVKFDRLLYNLMDNAIKHTRDRGIIRVSCDYTSSTLTISFSDTGSGMDEQTVKQVLQPFYQADSSRRAGGFGLGLSVVKTIIDQMNGTIAIESTPEIGTTVSMSIPASECSGES